MKRKIEPKHRKFTKKQVDKQIKRYKKGLNVQTKTKKA